MKINFKKIVAISAMLLAGAMQFSETNKTFAESKCETEIKTKCETEIETKCETEIETILKKLYDGFDKNIENCQKFNELYKKLPYKTEVPTDILISPKENVPEELRTLKELNETIKKYLNEIYSYIEKSNKTEDEKKRLRQIAALGQIQLLRNEKGKFKDFKKFLNYLSQLNASDQLDEKLNAIINSEDLTKTAAANTISKYAENLKRFVSCGKLPYEKSVNLTDANGNKKNSDALEYGGESIENGEVLWWFCLVINEMSQILKGHENGDLKLKTTDAKGSRLEFKFEKQEQNSSNDAETYLIFRVLKSKLPNGVYNFEIYDGNNLLGTFKNVILNDEKMK